MAMIKFYVLMFIKTSLLMIVGFLGGWLLALLPKSRKRKRIEFEDHGR